jgi:hypothetical protein
MGLFGMEQKGSGIADEKWQTGLVPVSPILSTG